MPHLPINFPYPHVVVLTETSVTNIKDDVSQQYQRGIYEFSSYKKARAFKALINSLYEGETIAHYFGHSKEGNII